MGRSVEDDGEGSAGAAADNGDGSAVVAADVEDAAGRAARVGCGVDNIREGSAGSGCRT